jgi:TonB family protein
MKICPTCKQNFPNGFQYCPNDMEVLLTQEDHQRLTQSPAPHTDARSGGERQREEVTARTASLPPPSGGSVAPRPEKGPARTAPSTPSTPHNAVGRGTGPAEGTRRETLPPPTVIAEPPSQSPFHLEEPAARRNGAARPTTELNFAIPEAGSLFARLSAGLQNLGDVFRKVRAPQPGEGDFRFLLLEESFPQRLGREFSAAAEEFRRNPKQFILDFARGEGSNLRRRNMLLAGSEMAIVGFFSLYFVMEALGSAGRAAEWQVKAIFLTFIVYLVGCYIARGFLLLQIIQRATRRLAWPKVALEVANWAPMALVLFFAVFLSNYDFYCRVFPGRCVPPEPPKEELTLLTPLTDVPAEFKVTKNESPLVEKRRVGGSLNRPKAASGGGGGGRSQPTPPSKGVPPQMALTPQIVMPNPEPPKIKDPSLAVVPTIYGDPGAMPPMKGPLGDPMGVPGPPSSGPGTGAGIGRGTGTGVGGGEGGGAGPGRGGNVGGGDMGLGGGRTVEPMSASLRPTIIYKEKAKYTEEARQNKVQGTVVLNVVFTADGRITNIRVVRGLPDGLTEKAIEAAQRIRFNPAVRAGQPVSVRGNLEFTFNLY